MEKQYGQHVRGRIGRLLTLAVFLGLGGSCGLLSAQTIGREVLASGGAEERQTLGTGGDPCLITWSIGEPMGETYTNSKKILSQGFLQGEGFILDTIGMNADMDADSIWGPLGVETERLVEIRCYPNPTHGPLQVVLNPLGTDGMVAEAVLTDLHGRRLQHASVGRLPWQETLDLSAYPGGTYLLRLTLRLSADEAARRPEAVRVKTYKIIKN